MPHLPVRTRVRIHAKHAAKRLQLPSPIRNLLNMPFSMLGVAAVVSGVCLVCLPAGLCVLGVALIGLEYYVSDGD